MTITIATTMMTEIRPCSMRLSKYFVISVLSLYYRKRAGKIPRPLSFSFTCDPLIGKLIVFAATREEALRKLRAALCELVIDGVETNIGEQLALISDARFASGNYDLTLIGEG